jgi:hypothetical protein
MTRIKRWKTLETRELLTERGGGEGADWDATQRCERVCRERVLTRYLIFFRRPMNVKRVIRSIFAATTSKGEISEEKDPAPVVFITLF